MLYDTMAQTPPAGSLLEALFVMLQMKREMAKLMETRLIVTAMRDDSKEGDVTQRAYDDYRHTMMPYLISEDRNQLKEMMRVLEEEARRGPFKVTSIKATPLVRSRLRDIAKGAQHIRPVSVWRRK
jgi:hypothetical protein